MKHLTMITAAIALAAIPIFAADSGKTQNQARTERRETKQDIEKLIKDINLLDNQPAARRAGISEAARQAAVPESRFDSKDSSRNIAGQFLAEEIAKNTKKSPQQIQKARTEAESWTQVATANRQDLATLEQKLTRIHEAMLDPDGTQARAKANTAAAAGKAKVPANNTATAEPAFDKSIQSVNSLGQEQEARRLAVDAIARETGLTRPQVEQAAEQNKQMGLGDLFVAQQLSVKTKKSVTELWNQHLSPKSWTDIAQENNENAAQLERQLARVEDSMRGRISSTTDAQRVRERDPNQSRVDSTTTSSPTRNTFDETAFQNSIQSLNSLGQNANSQTAGLKAISRESAVPLTQVQQVHQQNQGIGLGDLFVAQELSAKTKKSVDELWKAHLHQRTWAQVAADNNQDIGGIQRKLARVEQSLRDTSK